MKDELASVASLSSLATTEKPESMESSYMMNRIPKLHKRNEEKLMKI
jgi:hypothetical protein